MRRFIAALSGGMLVMAALAAGCQHNQMGVQQSGMLGVQDQRWQPATIAIPQGTPVQVRLTSTVGTDHSVVGDSWEGVLVSPVIVGRQVVFDEGSVVHGEVHRADPPRRGHSAVLDLAVVAIEENGDTQEVSASAEPVVAGSARARQLGAIAGGAVAGALLGKVVTGSGKGAVVGGVLGGAAGGVLSSKWSHVELKPGTVMTFRVDQQVALR